MFAAGAAAFVYSKVGRRVGYGNNQSVWGVVTITFVIVFIFFLTVLHLFVHS
jgi:hypothetical protein